MTNIDKIRGMSPKELAGLLVFPVQSNDMGAFYSLWNYRRIDGSTDDCLCYTRNEAVRRCLCYLMEDDGDEKKDL